MSRLNKVISDIPVTLTEEEVLALSQTLSAVSAANVGSGGEAVRYNGDGVTIVLNTTQNTFGLSDDYIAKIASIPKAVTDLTDSANYELASHAANTYLTKTSADTLYGAADDVSELKTASSTWNAKMAVPAKTGDEGEYIVYDTLGNWITLTAAAFSDGLAFLSNLDDYYKKTETSSKEAISAALTGKQTKISFTYTTASEHPGVKYLATLNTDGETYTIGDVGGGGGVISYSGRNGIDVSDNGIGLDANHLAAVQAVSGKVDLPTTAANKVYAYATTGNTTGWADITNKYIDASYMTIFVQSADFQTPGTGLTGGWDNNTGYSIGLDAKYKSAIESVSSMSSNAEIASALDLKQDALIFKGLNTGAITSINNSAFAIPDLPHITVLPGPYISAAEGTGSDAGKWTVGVNQTAEDYIDSIPNKVDKPAAALDDKYLVYSTLTAAGATTGWVELNTNYLPTSGGTVSGQTIISGDGSFDTENLKFIRAGQNGAGRIGLGGGDVLALKSYDNNGNTTQLNLSPTASNSALLQVHHNNSAVGYLIPAVTATTTAGLTNDGILHIILES